VSGQGDAAGLVPGLARVKRAVRRAIDRSGGIDGAAATVERRRSVVGDWNNLNHRALPSLDCALALDEVAVAGGAEPPIAAAYARELGGVFIPLPQAPGAENALAARVVEILAEAGDVAREVQTALADGHCNAAETRRMREQLSELMTACVAFDQQLAGLEKGA